MKEIIVYGRGGQGVVIASRLLAEAAFKEGKNVQSFPFFGVERRGTPVTAYTRISSGEIRKRGPVNKPDYAIVLDSTLLEDIEVTKGLKKGGSIIINTGFSRDNFLSMKKFKVFTFNASMMAEKHRLGSESAPIVNTSILGAFSKFTKEIELSPLLEAIRESISVMTEDNMKAAKEAYEKAV